MHSLSPHKSASSSSSSLTCCIWAAAQLSTFKLTHSHYTPTYIHAAHKHTHTHTHTHTHSQSIFTLPASHSSNSLAPLRSTPPLQLAIANFSRASSLHMVGYNLVMKPAWLEGLLSEKFFSPCGSHSPLKKNERNIYCLDCSLAICQHCLPIHPHPHRLLQIRRYVYHDVIRMQDIQKLLDCTFVQPYVINSAKVVFLNQRPQPRPPKGQGNMCESCERSLQDSYKYCSVACKVDAVFKQGKELQGLLRLCNQVQMPDLHAISSNSLALPSESCKMATKGPVFIGDDEEREELEQLSPNSVHRGPNLNSPTSSSSTANDGITWEPAMATVCVSKKLCVSQLPQIAMFASCKEQSYKHDNEVLVSCASGGVTFRTTLPCMKRRKGVPRRSPIF